MPSDKKLRKKIEKYKKRIQQLSGKMCANSSRSRSRSRSRSQLRDLRNPSICSSNADVLEIPEYTECFDEGLPNTESGVEDEDENLTTALKDALGVGHIDESKFEGKILSDIASCWDHILTNGLNKDEKDKILKKHKIPENCQLLEAPILNEEVKPAMTEASKHRDQTLETVQHQLGLATAMIGQVMTNLVEVKNTNKIELVTKLSEASKLLNDINFLKTNTRRNLIAPLLDKNFNNLIEKVKRDQHLYGIDLGSKIKTSQELKRSSLQIKKTTRPTQNRPTPKYKPAGNRYGPSQQHNQHPRAAAPRGGPKPRATHQPPPRRAAHSYSRSRPERAAQRGPYNKR